VNNTGITLFTASYNTRAATELAIRSAHRFAGCEFELIVGDSASEDGSRQMLARLEARGLLRLVSIDEPRLHSAWLDWFLSNCPTRVAVAFDSDIEFLRHGWLIPLVQMLNDRNAAFVGGESTPGSPNLLLGTGEIVHGMPRIVAPWLMAMDVEKVRPLGISFAYASEGIDERGLRCDYDVGGPRSAARRR
jgi:glycosyltransferase involved in cell wall biosynthesis